MKIATKSVLLNALEKLVGEYSDLQRENSDLQLRNSELRQSLTELSRESIEYRHRLEAENAALRTVLKRWLKVADDCHLEQQEVGYSEYNITAGLMVDTRALLDAARKEAQP